MTSPKYSVFVGNLPFSTTEEQLSALFAECGTVTEVAIPKTENGKPKGFGFVSFGEPAQVAIAVQLLDGKIVEGRQINVSPARNEKKENLALALTNEDKRIRRPNKKFKKQFVKHDQKVKRDQQLEEMASKLKELEEEKRLEKMKKTIKKEQRKQKEAHETEVRALQKKIEQIELDRKLEANKPAPQPAAQPTVVVHDRGLGYYNRGRWRCTPCGVWYGTSGCTNGHYCNNGYWENP